MATVGNGNGRNSDRLRSWKEIAAFFGTDERTARRWEARGLPVRRVPGGARSTVYAEVADLRAWLAADGRAPEPARDSDRGEAADAAPTRRARLGFVALAGLVLLLLAGGTYAVLRPSAAPSFAADFQPSARARELYNSAVYQSERQSPDSLRQAVSLYGQAIAEEPGFAEAHAGLAHAYMRLRLFSAMPEAEAYPAALVAAERALELDPDSAQAHAAIGKLRFYWQWDFARGLHHFREVTRIRPNDPAGYYAYGMVLLHSGDAGGALRQMDIAQQLDPRSRGTRVDRGLVLYVAGRRDEALALLQQMAREDPSYVLPHHYLGTILLSEGRLEEALEHLGESARLRQDQGRFDLIRQAKATLARSGPQAMWQVAIRGQERLQAAGREPIYVTAELRAMMGDRDGALAALRQSVAAREPLALQMRFDPLLRNLRMDPEFRRIAAGIGLPG